MSITKETQTDSTSDHVTSLDFSALKKEFKEEDDHLGEVYFNADNNKHIERLQDWCRAHWETVFKRSLLSSNTLFYHGCCNSFSRRHFVKMAGHLSMATCSIRKIPSFKDVNSPEELHRWLLKMITFNTNIGKQIPFPSINKYHIEDTSSDEEFKPNDDYTVLVKRVQSIQTELCQYKSQVKELQLDNSRLLSSTKSWCQKYQDLFYQQEKEVDSAFQTPLKPKVRSSFEFYTDNIYYYLPSASILFGEFLTLDVFDLVSALVL